jgi:uncharacterized protein (DUF1015 family)
MAGQRIEPFRALQYDPERAGPLSDLVAPPYDLIDQRLQEKLYWRSPYNVVRLELGRERDRYRAAAETLRQWLGAGILRRRRRPAVYLYSQQFEAEGRKLVRNGWMVRIRVEEFGPTTKILPHERTFAAPKEDRLKLLEATRANLSPIFGIYFNGPADTLEELARQIHGAPADLDLVDDLSIRNELRAVRDPEQIGLVQRALADALVLIADGHHRYETALNYRRRHHPGGALGAHACDYTLITLTSADDRGLVILPTHRLVARLDAAKRASFAAQANRFFTVEKLEQVETLWPALRERGRGSLAVALGPGAPLCYLLRPKGRLAAEGDAPGERVLAELDVSVLHRIVLGQLLGLSVEDLRAGNVRYLTDAGQALKAVSDGEADGAFLLNPPSIADVAAVSRAGGVMPEKSTYFYPKLLTGLVINPLDDDRPAAPPDCAA